MNRVALVIAVVIAAIPLSALAQFPEGKGSATRRAWSGKKPYASLFIAPDAQKPDTEQERSEIDRALPRTRRLTPPRVVCGMTVVQADPDVDPEILVKPDVERQPQGLKPKLRARRHRGQDSEGRARRRICH